MNGEKGRQGEKNKRLGEEGREINGGKIKRTNIGRAKERQE